MIRDAIAKLRLKLVDLTNRNRLLNFRFSDSSRKYVRVIDEVPELLYTRLTSEDGKRGRLYFVALPEPTDAEVDPDDTGVMAATAGPGVDRSPAKLMGRYAGAKTGDTEPQPKSRLNLAQWARENGIDPTYDLSDISGTGAAPQHLDSHIQTLLLPDVLSKKMARIRDDARVAEQELGVSTLYAAFGFLEWYEDRQSDEAKFAPLFLLPVHLDRDLKDQQYQYYIECGEGADAVSNISLRERLKRDFGFVLPELTEDEGPEQYLRAVQRAIQPMQRWRVRRFVVIGHFSFARLAMYEDLDPNRWTVSPLEEMDLIQDLLAGSESGVDDSYAEDIDPEAEEVESLVPALIIDADSSQYAAIVDAMRGRSFALKGPPGTGKSQTITNLIAAAIASHKRVLFVAEKLAALEVVSERLTEAGLGPFILELHSTKSQKKKIAQSFEERLSYKRRSAADTGANSFTELKKLQAQLRHYATLLNSPVGSSGLTLHDVIWREQRCRAQLSPWEIELSELRLECDTAVKAPSDVAADVDSIRLLVAAVEAVVEVSGDIEHHPLFGFGRISHDVAQQDAVRGNLKELQKTLDALVFLCDQLKQRLRVEVRDSIKGVEQFVRAVESVPRVKEPLTELYNHLRVSEDCRAHLAVIKRIEQASLSASSLMNYIGGFYTGLDSARSYAAACKELKALSGPFGWTELSLESAAGQAAHLQAESRRLRELVGLLNGWSARLGLSGPLRTDRLRSLGAAVRLLHETSPGSLKVRHPSLFREDASEAIRTAMATAQVLKGEEEHIKAHADLTFAEKPRELLSAALTIEQSGPIRRLFSSEYRAAKRLYRGFSRNRWERVAACNELRQWAMALKRRQEFDSSASLREDLGPSYVGIRTPFEAMLGVQRFWQAVRARWPLLDEEKGKVQQALLSGPLALLEDVRSAISAEDLSKMRFLEDGDPTGIVAVEGLFNARETSLARAQELLQKLAAVEWTREVTIEGATTLCSEWAAVAALVNDVGRRPAYPLLLPNRRLPDRSYLERLRATTAMALEVLEGDLPAGAQKLLLSGQVSQAIGTLEQYARPAKEAVQKARGLISALESEAGLVLGEWAGVALIDGVSPRSLQSLATQSANANSERYGEWANVCEPRGFLRANGAGTVADALVREDIPGDRAEDCYLRLYYRGLIHAAAEKAPELRSWNGVRMQNARARLAQLDRAHIKNSAAILIQSLASREIPKGISRGAKRDLTEQALIENEVGKQTRHVPIRSLLARAFNAAVALKPCFMMSPASVSQFLSAESASFDLVVIDEASQMRPEDALASLARTKQLVVVGDPMQLPPTTFFDSVEEEMPDDQDRDDLTVDTESILDLGLSRLRPARDLRWHYRSRHESLIAFSNRQFYNDRLIVFPSPVAKAAHLGIQFIHVADGYYRASLNLNEAARVVRTVQELVKENPNRSVGVVSINQPQRDLLADEFDRVCAQDPSMEEFRARWSGTLGEFFINNLENVQGHERDVIVISTVYGRSAPDGPVFQRFGPINSKVGHRRLNVLFTRARELVVLISSMQSEDIKVESTSAPGVIALKSYLEYARSGRLDGGERTGRSADSPFEEEVAYQLTLMGHGIEPQVGVAGYFIDMAVRHPTAQNHYVLGIECDGATYHSARCARDRDRLRQEILESLGWRLHRIWSTDWYRARDREIDRLKRIVADAIARAPGPAQEN